MTPPHEHIYLDNASTTQLDPRVLDAMLPWLSVRYGNPSSVHSFGREARIAVERAREHVAALIGVLPSEIIFTSGGTESDNAAIAFASRDAGSGRIPHIVTSAAEHQAVLQPIHGKTEYDVTYVDIDAAAVPPADAVLAALRPDTVLVALMHANNETGGILDLTEVSATLVGHPGIFFTDMVQSAGKLPIDLHEIRVDLAAISAHKIHGPKGIGALFVRRGIDMMPFMKGGAQERGRRGGTENVTGIVGFGEAARLAIAEMDERAERWRSLRRILLTRIVQHLPGIIVNGNDEGLPNIVNVSLPASMYPIDGTMLLMDLDLRGCAVSAGSACTAGSVEASHVLRALGHDEMTAKASVRFSFGAFTDATAVLAGAEIFANVVQDMLERSRDRSHSRSAIP